MLKPYGMNWATEKKDILIAIRRLDKLYNEIMVEFPQDIDGELSVSDMGKTYIRAFIYLEKDAPEEITKKAIRFIAKRYGKAQRDFRENLGTFMWDGKKQREDEYGKYEEITLIEHAHPQKCTIKKVKKTVEVYEPHCLNGGEKNVQT